MARWTCALELDASRRVVSGDPAALRDAIRRGADLRVGTAFRHNEHIDTSSADPELIREQMDFPITYLLEDRWVAGIETFRMPISIPDGFGARPSMSFFLYNEDGRQAIGRPYLDGQAPTAAPGPSPVRVDPAMPKMHVLDCWDEGTNAPCSNFIYDFESFRYMVRDGWREVLAHRADGSMMRGSVEELAAEAAAGREVKVAVGGLAADLSDDPARAPAHEVFAKVGPCYCYTRRKLFMGGAHPLVRVRPAIPLVYRSRGWDFGWIMPRSDGHVARWLCDPYTLRFAKSEQSCPIRWFVERD